MVSEGLTFSIWHSMAATAPVTSGGNVCSLGPEAVGEAIGFLFTQLAAKAFLAGGQCADAEHGGFIELWPAGGLLADKEADQAWVEGDEDE
nr:hypothetical protein [Arthrobacter sp. MYb23]